MTANKLCIVTNSCRGEKCKRIAAKKRERKMIQQEYNVNLGICGKKLAKLALFCEYNIFRVTLLLFSVIHLTLASFSFAFNSNYHWQNSIRPSKSQNFYRI